MCFVRVQVLILGQMADTFTKLFITLYQLKATVITSMPSMYNNISNFYIVSTHNLITRE